MTPGFATLLTSLGLILIALPWVLSIQRAPKKPSSRARRSQF